MSGNIQEIADGFIGQVSDPIIQKVLRSRMGIGTEAKSLEEVARSNGLSLQEVLRLEQEGLELLKGIVASAPQTEEFRNSPEGQRLLDALQNVSVQER